MENIRIGNSVHVSWRLYNNNGSQYALSGKIRRLWIISAALEKEITSYGIQGRNEIVFSVPADDLIRYGTYKIRLTIRESESETEDATYDLTQIFQVVSQSYPNASNAIGGVADLSFISVLNNVVIERIEGLSAYEIAVNNGYEGTEQEWIAMYDNAVTAANNAAEEAIAATETVMANEESRQLAESARDTAEQARMVAEQSRVSAEQARAQAEQARQTAEQGRASAEQARAIAETARVAAENARALAEDDRITSEQGRYSEELIRRGQEAERMDAETARRAAETARASAEGARVSAESGRVSAESSRESAEATRTSNESARVTAEASRVEAETFRQGAEQDRRQQFEGLKTDMETAIDNVDAKSAEIAEDIEGYEANEAARVSAEQSRVSAEQGRAAAETQRAEQAASDHTRAETDHTRAESDHTRAEEAAAAAEHMVDIKQGPQGPQGNTGSSVDYPYELVNNLTTDDATKGLSAAQGVVLDGKVSQLRSKVSEQVGLGAWRQTSIASQSNGIGDYASSTQVAMTTQTSIQNSGTYKVTCSPGYLFLIYVVGKITTPEWKTERTVNLVAGDVYRIAIKADPEVDFSSYTQEQIDAVVTASNIRMTGEVIVQELKQDVDSLFFDLGIYKDIQWERGNYTYSSSGWSYSISNSRVRTPETYHLYLRVGDVVGLTSYTGVKYYISWKDANGVYHNYSSWQSSDIQITQDGEYKFMLRYDPEVTINNIGALVGLFFVKPYRDLSRIVSTIYDIEIQIPGRGATLVSRDFRTIVGGKYRVLIPEPWDVSGISDSSTVFAVRRKENDSYTDIKTIIKSQIVSLPQYYEFTASSDTYNIAIRAASGTALLFYISEKDTPSVVGSFVTEQAIRQATILRGNTKGINHRGYNTIYPENTLLAFKGSSDYGFKYVETDVRFTSDGVAVLLHDESINRTARNMDGSAIANTVNIASITYAEALGYDFGIWKAQRFAGTKIPTFEEFLVLCRNLGLHPYIELKTGTESQLRALFETIHKYGIPEYTWIGGTVLLTMMSLIDNNARLGFVTSSVGSQQIETAASIMENNSNVFINASTINASAVSLCKDAGIPLESWATYAKEYYMCIENDYISGITNDYMDASVIKFLYEKRK